MCYYILCATILDTLLKGSAVQTAQTVPMRGSSDVTVRTSTAPMIATLAAVTTAQSAASDAHVQAPDVVKKRPLMESAARSAAAAPIDPGHATTTVTGSSRHTMFALSVPAPKAG